MTHFWSLFRFKFQVWAFWWSHNTNASTHRMIACQSSHSHAPHHVLFATCSIFEGKQMVNCHHKNMFMNNKCTIIFFFLLTKPIVLNIDTRTHKICMWVQSTLLIYRYYHLLDKGNQLIEMTKSIHFHWNHNWNLELLQEWNSTKFAFISF